MLHICPMPPIPIDQNNLRAFGQNWIRNGNRFSKKESMDFGKIVFDPKVAEALAIMLGGIPLVTIAPRDERLIPPQPHCVEIGICRTVGRESKAHTAFCIASWEFRQTWAA